MPRAAGFWWVERYLRYTHERFGGVLGETHIHETPTKVVKQRQLVQHHLITRTKRTGQCPTYRRSNRNQALLRKATHPLAERDAAYPWKHRHPSVEIENRNIPVKDRLRRKTQT